MRRSFLNALGICFFALSLCGCNKEAVFSDYSKLKCVNPTYSDYLLKVEGLSFIQAKNQGLKVDSKGIKAHIYKDSSDYSSDNPLQTYIFSTYFSDGKTVEIGKNFQTGHLLAITDDGIILSANDIYTISTLGGETIMPTPPVEIRNIGETKEYLTFVDADRSLDFTKYASKGMQLYHFYNGDGSLLCEKIMPSAESITYYDGPIPYKDGTYTKFYLFKRFEIQDGNKCIPQFDEVNVTDAISYELSKDKSHYVVSAKSDFKASSLKISPTFNEIPVTEIATNGFKDATSLVKIDIPESIEKIGDDAFSGCINLREITNTEQITSFGTGVFNKTGLTSITINENITRIPDNFVSNSPYLKEVIWDIQTGSQNGVSYDIRNGSFSNCKSLTKISFTQYVDTFYAGSLSGLSNLKYIYLKNNATVTSTAFSNSNFDIYVTGSSLNKIIISNYSGKIRYYSETQTVEVSLDPDSYWHYSEEGYPTSWY